MSKPAEIRIVDRTDRSISSGSPEKLRPAEEWPPVLISRARIEYEVERLADLPKPGNGRREALFVHPCASDRGQGLAPGIQFALNVLKPGEETEPIRHNSTQVNFCILGSGHSIVDGARIPFSQYDLWNHPAYATYRHVNDSKDLQVRFTYSNAPLLDMLRVHLVDEQPPEPLERPETSGPQTDDEGCAAERQSPFGTFAISDDGAQLMPYEILINPPAVESRALHWPWRTVKENLDRLAALGKEYVGRRLYLLYNPVTGRTNGTTPNFFATITIRPAGIVDRPHRHVSSAINYYFHGRGYSIVDGQRYDWEAGDLMLSAPGWAVHNHASVEDVYELTVQDQPLHIMMESLLWKEDLSGPSLILGKSGGFATNRPVN